MCRVNLNDATNPNLVFNVVTMKLADSVTAGVEISGSTTAIISRQFSGTAVVFEPQPWVSSGKTSSGTVTLSFTKFEVFKNLDGLYVPSTSVALSQKTLSMSLAAGPQTLTATVAPSTATNQSLTWSSNKTSVATVDSTGKVTPVAVGTAVIKAYSVDGGLQDTCTVTVTQ